MDKVVEAIKTQIKEKQEETQKEVARLEEVLVLLTGEKSITEYAKPAEKKPNKKPDKTLGTLEKLIKFCEKNEFFSAQEASKAIKSNSGYVGHLLRNRDFAKPHKEGSDGRAYVWRSTIYKS